jgi:hypothetical protein
MGLNRRHILGSSEMGKSRMHRKSIGIIHHISSFVRTHRLAIIILLIFLLDLILVSPQLMPNYSEVNPDDEAKYVDSGWRLLRGDIRDLAWGPIVALVYAPAHLVVGSSPDWFMLELWTVRFILFAFLWWGIFYLGYQIKEIISPFVLVAVLFVSTPFFAVVVNQSDAVLVGFSTLALANLVKFCQNAKVRHLGLASLFVGLGVLARVETVILFMTLLVFGLVIGKGKVALLKLLSTAALPILAVIGLYLAASQIWMGKVDLGMANKSYDSFEMNQSILTGGDIALARQETRRLFGTQEENQGSILTAILRNPLAFTQRILANIKTIPTNYLNFFSKKLGPIGLLFSVYGIYSLIRKKAWMRISLLLIWPLHSLVALGFLSLHIIPQTIYLPLLLGAIGITEFFSSRNYKVDKLVFISSTFLLCAISWLTNKPAFLICFLLLGFVEIIYWITVSEIHPQMQGLHFSILLLLAAGLILREPYQFPNYPVLGESPSEQAIHFLEARLPALSTILVPYPLPAIAAKMSYQTMDVLPDSIISIADFTNFLHQNSVQAVYLDSNRRGRNDIYNLMEQGFEQDLSLEYISADQSIRVFLVR